MNWVADQIVDDHRSPAHPQTLIDELNEISRFQMMSKEAATH